jgi:hypothetical protein
MIGVFLLKMDAELTVVDIGLLAEVCREGLKKYNYVTVKGLKAEYSVRSGCDVPFITEKMLSVAMVLVPDGELWYHHHVDGREASVGGIRRGRCWYDR